MNEKFRKTMKIVPLGVAIFFIFIFHCNAKGHEYTAVTTARSVYNNGNHETAEGFRNFEKFLKNGINTVFKKILPYVMEFSEKVNVSQDCMRNSLHLMNGVRNIKKSAMQFLDASGKIPDGLMYGSFTALGNYKECLDIEVKSTRKKDLGEKLYQGQYCMIELKSTIIVKKPKAQYMHDLPVELKGILQSDSVFSVLARYIYYINIGAVRIGACLPTGCTKDDINSVLQLVGRISSNINATTLTCEKKEENKYTPAIICVFTFYSLICFLVLVGSMVDIYFPDPTFFKSKTTKALLAFSLVTNFRKFCSPKQSPDTISCLNGMKFFGLAWIVAGHTFMAGLGPLTHGILKFAENTKEFAIQALLNGMFAVDTFFMIGSFLVGYLVTKHAIQQKKKFNVLMYIAHRLLRLYPAYITLLTIVVIVPLFNSGPFMREIMHIQMDPCLKNWWANLLFINNFYESLEVCLLHTWYITLDVQLYIFSLIFIIPLIRWPKVGLSLMFLGILGHILFSGISTYIKDWPPVMLFSLMDMDETLEFYSNVYLSPLTHIGPYAMGLLLGYIYAMNPDFKMSRLMQVLGWCVAFTCSFSVLYGTREWYIRPMPQYLAVIYAALSRTAWTLGPAWIIFCCATGHGGILNWLLSWRIFIHLGRLAYTTYLIHFLPMIVLYAGLKARVQSDLYMSTWFFIGNLCSSLLLGLVLHLLIEVPFANLVRIFLPQATKTPEKVEKEKSIGSEEDKKCDIIILTPSEKDCSTKL